MFLVFRIGLLGFSSNRERLCLGGVLVQLGRVGVGVKGGGWGLITGFTLIKVRVGLVALGIILGDI